MLLGDVVWWGGGGGGGGGTGTPANNALFTDSPFTTHTSQKFAV